MRESAEEINLKGVDRERGNPYNGSGVAKEGESALLARKKTGRTGPGLSEKQKGISPFCARVLEAGR